MSQIDCILIWDATVSPSRYTFSPCSCFFLTLIFFLICSYTRQMVTPETEWRKASPGRGARRTLVATSKHMRWVMDCSSACLQSNTCTYLHSLWRVGCDGIVWGWGWGNSWQVQVWWHAHSWSCLSSYLHVLKDPSVHHSRRVWPPLKPWKDIRVSAWVIGPFKRNKQNHIYFLNSFVQHKCFTWWFKSCSPNAKGFVVALWYLWHLLGEPKKNLWAVGIYLSCTPAVKGQQLL